MYLTTNTEEKVVRFLILKILKTLLFSSTRVVVCCVLFVYEVLIQVYKLANPKSLCCGCGSCAALPLEYPLCFIDYRKTVRQSILTPPPPPPSHEKSVYELPTLESVVITTWYVFNILCNECSIADLS